LAPVIENFSHFCPCGQPLYPNVRSQGTSQLIGVSLSTFIDFVEAANPTTRVSLVKQTKEFYKDDGTTGRRTKINAHYPSLKRAPESRLGELDQ